MTIQRVKAAAVLLALSLWCDGTAWAERRLGAQGVEGASHRRQEWLVPAPDPAMPSRALLFRPPGKGPFRIAVIAHASTQNRLARAQMPQPDYPGLTAALVARGFAVLVPQRLGHGQTGGPYLEDQEGCDDAEYLMAARATADSIVSALAYIRAQPFARKDGSLIVGHSAGGWGALGDGGRKARRPRRRRGVRAGRGGRKDGRAGASALRKKYRRLRRVGEGARVAVTCGVGEHSYFPPVFARRHGGGLPQGRRHGGGPRAAAVRQRRPLARGGGRRPRRWRRCSDA